MSSSRAASLVLALGLVATPGCLSISDRAESSGGAGTAGHAGSGGSTASGGTFPSTGGGSGAENCLNGSDDDGDSHIDCADSDCTKDYECVDVPSGWTAVLAADQAWSNSLSQAAPCAGGDAPVRYFEGPAGPPACGACTCGDVSGTCGATPIACALGNIDCSGATPFDVSGCTDFVAPPVKQISCVLGATPLAIGSCPPSAAAPSTPPWLRVADTCRLNTGGCGASQACVPKQPAASSTCIEISGAASCPLGFSTLNDAYTGGNDDRACSDCTCTPDQVTCAADTFNLMTMAGCTDFGPLPQFYGTKCVGWSPSSGATWSIQRVAASKTPTGSCTPGGGVSSGSVQPQGKTTLCCR